MASQYVFGYGSLAAELRDAGFAAELPGFRRAWGVAMDNRRDLPGYKYYTTPDGVRPAVFVSFLDIAPATGGASSAVNGLCLPVGAGELERLDRRERNYARVDVSGLIDVRRARVWAYVGTAEARERLRTACAAGRAVIDAAYLRAVTAAFATLGPEELARCQPSLEPGAIPVRELNRHELPEAHHLPG